MGTSTAVVKSGGDLVQQGTGEVIGTVDQFSMPDYLTGLTSKASIDHQHRLAHAYDTACASLIGPNDVQKDGNRTFKKKSAWRKLARHFGISTAVERVTKEMLGETFCATVTVKALAPWGQSAEAVGACASDEATGRRVITIADAIATAETRATNRAVSNLIAMGEVSAEEMSKGSNGGGQAENKSAADKIMPFGSDKGKRLGDIPSESLSKTITWCEERGKFADLVEACSEVIQSRAATGGESAEEELPY